MENKNTIFGNGKFYKSVLAIAVPIMLQQLILIFHFWMKKERWLNNLTCQHQPETLVQKAS